MSRSYIHGSKTTKKDTRKVIHVLCVPLHKGNRLHPDCMVSCSCFSGMDNVGVYVGKLSEIKWKIAKNFLDTEYRIVYT